MRRGILFLAFAAVVLLSGSVALASPPESTGSRPAAGVSPRDRVYAADQFSNTVSVVNPADNTLLGVIRLGDPAPGNFSPLYRGQLLVHGLGFSPDHRTLAVVSIGSNAVTFIDTATNAVLHTTYLGRSPHEAFFTPDGREVWVSVRGESYVSVLDAATYQEKTRIETPPGPGMTVFSPDGRHAFVCSSFTPETTVIAVASRQIVGKVAQLSPFCPNLAVSPDGKQVWLTLKDIGKVMVLDASPPFAVRATLDTGPITNHVSFARTARGQHAFVTVGGRNELQVFRTEDFSKIATIALGKLPHGLWPAHDGSRMYVGLENDDALAVVDTATHKVVATVPVGQAPQAVVYVRGAVPEGDGRQNLMPLGLAGQATRLRLVSVRRPAHSPTSVTLFDQGLVQVLQAAVTALAPKQPHVLGLASQPDGGGAFEPLAAFTSNPSGAAVVNAIGPIRQHVTDSTAVARRYLVISEGTPAARGPVVQVQSDAGAPP